jgi:uncharacterized membrane protein YhiD involved in acid resistance
LDFWVAEQFSKLGSNVRGLTTAEIIWAVAAVGLTVGAGL